MKRAWKLYGKNIPKLKNDIIVIQDIETPLDTLAHIEAMKDYKNGETKDINEIDWN